MNCKLLTYSLKGQWITDLFSLGNYESSSGSSGYSSYSSDAGVTGVGDLSLLVGSGLVCSVGVLTVLIVSSLDLLGYDLRGNASGGLCNRFLSASNVLDAGGLGKALEGVKTLEVAAELEISGGSRDNAHNKDKCKCENYAKYFFHFGPIPFNFEILQWTPFRASAYR